VRSSQSSPAAEREKATTGSSRWAWAALYVVCATVLVTDGGHFLPPAGERFVDYLKPGAADLIPSLNAANALLHGENPYHARNLFVADPYDYSRGSHIGLTYLYPPSHALVYVPLTWLARGDYPTAMRLQFVVQLLCIALIALCIVRLLGHIRELAPAVQNALIPGLCLAIGLNPGNQLGFERGQSDLITSAFGWCAVLACTRGRWLTAAFMGVAATVLKGYGILFASGLILLGLTQSWRRTLLGALSGVLILFAPVARYLPDALEAYKVRSGMFWTSWNNQSFSNLAHHLDLAREQWRLLFTLAAVGCSVLAWLQLWRSTRAGDLAQRSLWLCAFATAAFASVLGYSLNSVAYDTVIVMPGVLIVGLAQDRLLPLESRFARGALGVFVCVCLAAVFVFDVGLALGVSRWHVPASIAGQVGVLALIGFSAARALARVSLRHRIGVLTAAALCVLAATAYLNWPALEAWAAGPNLVPGKAWTTSSTALICHPEQRNCGGRNLGVFFHTRQEHQPWLRIDLGAEHDVSFIELQNRLDCCRERAVPLVVELSKDGTSFHRVAQQNETFEVWRAKWSSQRARYVRIRCLRETALHLERVEVR